MWKLIRRILRTLAVAAGLLVIVAAILLGAFRLFAASLPSYKEDLQAWVSKSLELSVQYESIDLRLGFSGPELAFFDAAVSRQGVDQPFVLARRASVVIDPLALVLDRQLVPVRLVFEGIRITVQRSADGTFSVAGAPQGAADLTLRGMEIPEEVSVRIRDSEVEYVDEILGIRWHFGDVRADIEQEFRAVSVSVSAEPPEEFGDRISVTANGITTADAELSDDWRVFVALRNANLDAIADVWPQAGVESGAGDISLWLQSDDGVLVSALADVALDGVVVPYRGESLLYEHIELIGELTHQADAWDVVFSDVNVTGPGGEWPRDTTSTFSWQSRTGTLEVRSDFLRLDDLLPFVAALPDSDVRDRALVLEPRGDLEDVDARVRNLTGADFAVTGRFADLGVSDWNGFETLQGLTGELRVDAGGGTLRLASPSVTVRRSELLDRTVDIGNLNGFLQWRAGRDATRVLSDSLSFEWLGATVSASGELSLPNDSGSPVLELEANVSSLRVADALPFVTAVPMDARLRAWLASALNEGTLERTDIEFYGPLSAFPFDYGEGEFVSRSRVRGGAIDYVPDWPRAEGFNGVLEFRNASLLASGRARVLGNVSEDVLVGIDDMRVPVLTIDANTQGPLGDVLEFLLTAPPIAEYLGPDYARLRAPEGLANLRLDLDIPLPDTESYELAADLAVTNGTLELEGFGPRATDLEGMLSLADGLVLGRGISGTFLEGPAYADVETLRSDGYRMQLNLSGEVSADAIVRAFDLPYGSHVAGQTRWEGQVMLPDVGAAAGLRPRPTLLEVQSNLSGIALRLPAPFRKPPGDATNLAMRFAFNSNGGIDVTANLGSRRHFIGAFRKNGETLELADGTLAFGELPERGRNRDGLSIIGELPAIDLDEWLALSESPRLARPGSLLANVDLHFADLQLWQQAFGPTDLQIERRDDAFSIEIDSLSVAGHIDVPDTFASRAPISASLRRLYWQPGESLKSNTADPRGWPGLEVDIDDFRLGMRKFGALHAQVDPDPLGLRLVSFSAESPSLTAEGSGAWLVEGDRTMSRLAVNVSATDVAAALEDFDLDPVLSGDDAQLTATLRWPDGPSGGWMDHLSGDLSLRIAEGSMLDIEPGAGRLVGLMSIVALPRRLSLDFRDVFNRGFVFDEISADFMISDGNAFTDNLKLAGPAAEIGVVGRTGLRDKDFQQQAVVTAEPSNMLPTVGGLLAGPGVGAALLIFTRIFKEPLKGIGRASYCITGSWDDPDVARLTQEQLEAGEICADLPPGWVTADSEVISQ